MSKKYYVNGVPMAFALSAYLNNEETTTQGKELTQAARFSNYVERGDNDDDGCDEIEFTVNSGVGVNIYVDGEFAYGPIVGHSVVTIR